MAGPDAIALPRVDRLARLFPYRDPLFFALILVILLLGVLIVYPATTLLLRSVVDGSGAFSSVWYVRAYTSTRNLWAILNTLIIAAGTTAVATLTGTLLAWSVVRTDMPARRLIGVASIVPFISTPFIGALA